MFVEDYAKLLTVLKETTVMLGRSGDLIAVLPKGLQGRIVHTKTFADRLHLPKDEPDALRMVYFVSGLRCRSVYIPEHEYEGTHSFEVRLFELSMKRTTKDNLPPKFRFDC
jgi:hypothetical protein